MADIVKLPSTAVDLIEARYQAQEAVNKQFNGLGTLDLLSGGFVGNIVYQKQQYEGIWNTVKNTFNDTILNGSSEERGNLTGEVIGNVTVGLAATEGLSALGSETELLAKAKVPETVVDDVASFGKNTVGAAEKYLPSNIKMVDDKFLKKNGIDAHALKEDFIGKKNIAHYDIYTDKDTGMLWIYRKGGKGEPIPTYEYIKGK